VISIFLSQLTARFTISIVSTSIYNVDPKTFEGQESEILKTSQMFATPTKKFMILLMLNTLYPFLSKYLKFSFSQPGAENFFIELMDRAIKYRDENNIKSADYLDHLMNLRNRKEISGQLPSIVFATFIMSLTMSALYSIRSRSCKSRSFILSW
jgi:hypothetical protein